MRHFKIRELKTNISPFKKTKNVFNPEMNLCC